MMGNQRQLLKENIGMDLKTKIENAQVLLTKFKSEQHNMEKTCVQVNISLGAAGFIELERHFLLRGSLWLILLLAVISSRQRLKFKTQLI